MCVLDTLGESSLIKPRMDERVAAFSNPLFKPLMDVFDVVFYITDAQCITCNFWGRINFPCFR